MVRGTVDCCIPSLRYVNPLSLPETLISLLTLDSF